MRCSRQEYWSGLPVPSPGDLLNPGTETVPAMFPALAFKMEILHHWATWEAQTGLNSKFITIYPTKNILGLCFSLYVAHTHFLSVIFLSCRRHWHPIPVLLPGKSDGERSLVGYSPWGCKSRTWLSNFTFTFIFLSLYICLTTVWKKRGKKSITSYFIQLLKTVIIWKILKVQKEQNSHEVSNTKLFYWQTQSDLKDNCRLIS